MILRRDVRKCYKMLIEFTLIGKEMPVKITGTGGLLQDRILGDGRKLSEGGAPPLWYVDKKPVV